MCEQCSAPAVNVEGLHCTGGIKSVICLLCYGNTAGIRKTLQVCAMHCKLHTGFSNLTSDWHKRHLHSQVTAAAACQLQDCTRPDMSNFDGAHHCQRLCPASDSHSAAGSLLRMLTRVATACQ